MTLILARSRLLPDIRMPVLPPRALWTLVGATAVPLWATWPLLAATTASALPLFQYLAILFAVGAVTLVALRRVAATGAKVRPAAGAGWRGSAWAAAWMVALGLLASDVLFIRSLGYIPAAEANLLLYLWPLMVVGMASLLRLVRLRRLHVLAMALGIVGAVLVLGGRPENLSPQGTLLALGGGATWALYVVFRMWQGDRAPDALALGLGLSAALSFGLHLLLEDWLSPSLPGLLGAVLAGIGPLALGNLAWDVGARRGDRVTLATLAYATPLVAALLLAAAGLATLGLGLVAGGALIVLGGYVSSRAG